MGGMETRCDHCGYVFSVPEESEGLSAECPHCGEETVAELHDPSATAAEMEAEADFKRNMPMAEPVETPSLLEERKDEAVQRAIDGHRKLSDLEDYIRQPDTTFMRDVLRSFALMYRGSNEHMLSSLLAIDGLIVASLFLVFIGVSFLFAAGILFLTVLLAWHSSLLLKTCEAACSGNDDLKINVFSEGIVQDLAVPLFRMLASIVIVSSPALVYGIIMELLSIPRPSMIVDIVLLAVGFFAWPATILALVLGDSVVAINPVNVYRMIVGAIRPYLVVWLTLLGLMVVSAGCASLLLLVAKPDRYGTQLLAAFVIVAVLSNTSVIAFRIIGLMYRHFKARLPFAAE